MPVDPQARALLDQIAAMGTPEIQTLSVSEARQLFATLSNFLTSDAMQWFWQSTMRAGRRTVSTLTLPRYKRGT